MKILITQETDWLKRNPLQQHHLAEMLSLRGHEVRVIDHEILWKTQGKREFRSQRKVFRDVSKIYPGAKVTVIRPGLVKFLGLGTASLILSHNREINRQIKEFHPDVIVGFGILNSYLALRAAHKHNLPFVYHWLDVLHWLIPFKPFRPVGKIVESATLKRADCVIAVSDKLKDFVAKLGTPTERIRILKPGVSLKRFDLAISGEEMRKRYGLKRGDVVLLFMGWLYHFSGLKEVARRLAETEDRRLKLLIVGEGDAYDELQQIRQECNLHGKVILTGKRPYGEIPALVAASDICLLPAYPDEQIMQDGLPGKIYEYLAMAKPMISTKLPGIMKEFGQGNGVVYIDQPEDAVAKAIEMVDQGEVKELGGKARAFVEKYDWGNIADEFERILEEVILGRDYGQTERDAKSVRTKRS